MLSKLHTRQVGEYTYYPATRILRIGQKVVDLTQKQSDLLVALLAVNGEVVPRSALMDAVWGNVCVEDHNLTQTVFLLRRSLGKLPTGQEYIETVSRRGYRIAAAALRVSIVEVPKQSLRGRFRLTTLQSTSRRALSWINDALRLSRTSRA